MITKSSKSSAAPDLEILVDEATRRKIEADLAADVQDDFEVDAENWEATKCFLGCATQWKWNEFAGRRTGFDYNGVDVVMRNYEVSDKKECFLGIQTMEFAALEAIAQAKS